MRLDDFSLRENAVPLGEGTKEWEGGASNRPSHCWDEDNCTAIYFHLVFQCIVIVARGTSFARRAMRI